MQLGRSANMSQALQRQTFCQPRPEPPPHVVCATVRAPRIAILSFLPISQRRGEVGLSPADLRPYQSRSSLPGAATAVPRGGRYRSLPSVPETRCGCLITSAGAPRRCQKLPVGD